MKKRIASLLAALALCLTLLPMAAFAEDAAPDAWDGTADTSWYDGHESDAEYHITTGGVGPVSKYRPHRDPIPRKVLCLGK